MAYSVYNLTESEEADKLHNISQRNIDLTEDLKYRAEGMLQKWIDCNGVKLKDRVWQSWATRNQERLRTVMTSKLNEFLTQLCGDHLAEDEE